MDLDLKADFVFDVRRKDIEVAHDLNQRRYLGNLPRMGASLEKEGQTNPLICVPRASKKGPRFSLRDGFRRVTAVDQGYAPGFARSDRWMVVLLTRQDGSLPSDAEVRRYCRATNNVRENWTDIEEAEYYEAEIREMLGDVESLGPREHARRRADAIRKLAKEDGVSDRTVRYRLDLLRLPAAIQEKVASGHMTSSAAREMLGAHLNDDEMVSVIEEAAIEEKVDLSESQLPGDLDLRRPSTPGSTPRKEETAEGNGVRRIQVQTVQKVIQRKTKAVPKQQVRNLTWFREEIDRVQPLTKAKGEKALKAKVYLQALRLAIGETDKAPV